jgi:hypothetical protein
MGFLRRVVLGRWLARWLMRGSPLAVAAKLLAVGALGAWKYRRDRQGTAGRDPRQIDADYEILGPERIAPVARGGTEPIPEAEGNGGPEFDGGSRTSEKT